MTKLIDNLLIVMLIAGAFVSGLYLAGRYYKKLLAELQWLLKVLVADRGLGYIAPPKDEPDSPISQEFYEHMRKNGHATTALRTSRH
jgi:hypothetical protein